MTHETYTGDNNPGTESGIETTESNHDDAAQVVPELSAFQLRALATLVDQDRRGIGIKDVLSEHYGEQINHGRLYPNLDKLADRGLIEKSQRNRRTNNYALTDLGATVLEHELDWLTDQVNGGGV